MALVSCTVWQERAEAGQKVRQDMQGPFAALTEAARTVAKVHRHHTDTAAVQTLVLSKPVLQSLLLSKHRRHSNCVVIHTLPHTANPHSSVQTFALSNTCLIQTLPWFYPVPSTGILANAATVQTIVVFQTRPAYKHCQCANIGVIQALAFLVTTCSNTAPNAANI